MLGSLKTEIPLSHSSGDVGITGLALSEGSEGRACVRLSWLVNGLVPVLPQGLPVHLPSFPVLMSHAGLEPFFKNMISSAKTLSSNKVPF